MKLRVRHQTEYKYTAQVSQAVNQLCLTPRSTALQSCLMTQLDVTPAPDSIDSAIDSFGNAIGRFSLDQPHTSCSIVVTSMVETSDQLPLLTDSPALSGLSTLLASQLGTGSLMAHDCLLPSHYIPLNHDVDQLISELQPDHQTVLGFSDALMQLIYSGFSYDPSFSTLVTPIKAVLEERKGVCQDFAHLAIAVLRRVGIPARYVSGYLETMPPPGQTKLRGSDASHAWYSVYVPDSGWFDFDPTNNKRPDAQYITTAWGRDYGDVAPLKGVVFGGGKHTLSVSVDVDRIAGRLESI